MPSPISEETGWLASVIVALSTISITIWRALIRARKDLREDAAGTIEGKTYREIIGDLRAEVRRLADTVTDISARLDTERRLRVEAQNEVIELKSQVAALKRELQVYRANRPKGT